MSQPTILMYSPDSIGLGHMQRNSAISRQLIRKLPDANVLMLVGSGVGAFFVPPRGVDSVKLPSVQKTAANTWQPKTLSLNSRTVYNLRAGLILETVKVLAPDVLVIDHLITGVWDELLPTLEMIRSEGGNTKVILGLRDILDAPDQIKQNWADLGYYDLIAKYYDEILIYGCPEIFPSAGAYGLEERFANIITYCGYVCSMKQNPQKLSDEIKISVKELKDQLGGPDEQLVLIMAGGGHDAYPMMTQCVSAMRTQSQNNPARTVMITGPLMPKAELTLLQHQSAGLPITILPWTKDIEIYLLAADLVITMGGYNSLMETVRLGKQTIVIPRNGATSEQKMRAKLFSDMGLVKHLTLENLGPSSLMAEIENSLQTQHSNSRSLPFTGVKNAAEVISQQVAKTRSHQPGHNSDIQYLVYSVNG